MWALSDKYRQGVAAFEPSDDFADKPDGRERHEHECGPEQSPLAGDAESFAKVRCVWMSEKAEEYRQEHEASGECTHPERDFQTLKERDFWFHNKVTVFAFLAECYHGFFSCQRTLR